MSFTADGTETSKGVTAVLYPSLDGTLTNADLVHPIVVSNTLSSLSTVIMATNLASAAYSGYQGVGGFRFLLLRYMTNAAGTAAATNVMFAVPYKRTSTSGL